MVRVPSVVTLTAAWWPTAMEPTPATAASAPPTSAGTLEAVASEELLVDCQHFRQRERDRLQLRPGLRVGGSGFGSSGWRVQAQV